MELDAALRKAAKAVLGKFGTDVVIQRTTGTVYSTSLGKMTPVTSDTDLKGRLDNYTDRELAFGSGLIKAGDRKLTIAASDTVITPTISDKALIGGIVYEIVRVDSDIATDQAAIYTLQVRR